MSKFLVAILDWRATKGLLSIVIRPETIPATSIPALEFVEFAVELELILDVAIFYSRLNK
jgi:hypothetical protein